MLRITFLLCALFGLLLGPMASFASCSSDPSKCILLDNETGVPVSARLVTVGVGDTEDFGPYALYSPRVFYIKADIPPGEGVTTTCWKDEYPNTEIFVTLTNGGKTLTCTAKTE